MTRMRTAERKRAPLEQAPRAAEAASVIRRSLVLAALLGVTLYGCGGGGQSAQEKRFIAQGNAICAQELAILNRTPEPVTPTQAISYLPKAIAIIQRQSARMQALTAPPAKRAAVAAALSSGHQLAAVLEAFLHKLRTGSLELSTFAQVQSQSVSLREQINADFRRAGLKGCVTST